MAGCKGNNRVRCTTGVAAVCVVLGLAALCTMTALATVGTYKQHNWYCVVFDAGSTHTSVAVYQWNATVNGTGIIQQIYQSIPTQGLPLSGFGGNFTGAGRMISSLLDLAKSAMPDQSAISLTPVYLGATAGMRVLKKENSEIADQIMSSVKSAVKDSEFSSDPKEVKILTGQEESIYGWIESNYLSGTFGTGYLNGTGELTIMPLRKFETIGALDLGGASTQISYAVNSSNPDSRILEPVLFANTYHVYAQSFLCRGLVEAHRRHLAMISKKSNYSSQVSDPCALNGTNNTMMYGPLFDHYCTEDLGNGTDSHEGKLGVSTISPHHPNTSFIGAYNHTECAVSVRSLLNLNLTCSQCTVDGAYLPPTVQQNAFMAFSAFNSIIRDLGFGRKSRTSNAIIGRANFTRGLNEFCASHAKKDQSMDMQYFVCFGGHFLQSLLEEGYKMNTEDSWSRIMFSEKIRTFATGWTLGLTIAKSTGMDPFQTFVPRVSPSSIPFILVLCVGSLLLVGSVIFLLGLAVKRHRRNLYPVGFERL